MPAERLVVHGRVQGVGFRWWAMQTARRRGVRGWVRNRRDGTVEILAIGETLDAFAGDCALGPPAAQVTGLERRPAEDDGSTGFDKRPTE